MFDNNHLVRQAEIIPVDKQDIGITIIGAGAIGSFAALALVKSGFNKIRVYDFDDVSIENMSCQGYRRKDIGKPKVEALKEIIYDFTEVEIEIVNDIWEPNYNENPIVITAVDSMEARTEIFNEIRAKCYNVQFIIDPRMSAEQAMMICMSPFNEPESYEKTLYTDENAVQERCTAKATNYTSNMLAGLVVKCVKNLALGQSYPRFVSWNIAENSMDAFTKVVEQTKEEPKEEKLKDFWGEIRVERKNPFKPRNHSMEKSRATKSRIHSTRPRHTSNSTNGVCR